MTPWAVPLAELSCSLGLDQISGPREGSRGAESVEEACVLAWQLDLGALPWVLGPFLQGNIQEQEGRKWGGEERAGGGREKDGTGPSWE